MSQDTLEERLTQLEKRVDELVQHNSASRQSGSKDWRRTVGMFKGDPIMKTIIDEALRSRENERRAAEEQNGTEKP